MCEVCSINHNTVADYLRRATAAGLDRWPLPADVDEAALEARLFPARSTLAAVRPIPDWAVIHDELRRNKHVTLQLLWQEHKQFNPEGHSYSRFCELYQEWSGKLDVVLRQEHRAGEKLFVDYAGAKFPVIDAKTGTIQEASIFVAVLGASNYTFAEATWNQDLSSWIGSHVRALDYFQGSPALIVPDNLNNAITRPPSPSSNFSRKTSLIFRMDNLSAGTRFLLVSKGATVPANCPAPLGRGNSIPTCHTPIPTATKHWMASLRNRWMLCVGITGWIRSESVDAFDRNHCLEWAEIRSLG